VRTTNGSDARWFEALNSPARPPRSRCSNSGSAS